VLSPYTIILYSITAAAKAVKWADEIACPHPPERACTETRIATLTALLAPEPLKAATKCPWGAMTRWDGKPVPYKSIPIIREADTITVS